MNINDNHYTAFLRSNNAWLNNNGVGFKTNFFIENENS